MYQVVIDNYNHNFNSNSFLVFNTYNRLVCTLRYKINSPFYSVYVRKVCKDMIGSFKLINRTSYTFTHFFSVKPEIENYVCNLWSNNHEF